MHTTTDNDLTVEVTEYDKATLLCPVEISALNSFEVTWNRFESGTFTSLTNEINPDYSMQLTNVTFRDSNAVFRCEVRSTPFSTEQLGTILGPRITLTISRKHSKRRRSTGLLIMFAITLCYQHCFECHTYIHTHTPCMMPIIIK